MRRKNHQQRNHEQNLTRQRQEHRFAGHTQRLEEVGRDNLKTDHPETESSNLQTTDRGLYLFFIGHEERGYMLRHELTDDGSDGRHYKRNGGRQLQRLEKTVVAAGAVIVSQQGLHSLAYTDDDEYEHRYIAVEDHNGRYGVISAVTEKGVVDYGVDGGSGDVNQERRHTDI